MGKNVIFFFSGTGNCLSIARNIAKGIGGAQLIRIKKGMPKPDLSDADRVGFVFPCYGGGAPEDVLDCAKTLKVKPGAYTFGVTSCAAYKGTGLAKLHKIIPLKYWSVVTHHCSCIWLFPHDMMMPRLTIGEAEARNEDLSAKIAKDIVDGKTRRKPGLNVLNAFENMGFSKMVEKKAAAFSVSDKCIGCGQCMGLCPRGNITIIEGKAKIGTNCTQCLSCLQYCPQSAISIGEISEKREHYHNPNVKPADLMQDKITV